MQGVQFLLFLNFSYFLNPKVPIFLIFLSNHAAGHPGQDTNPSQFSSQQMSWFSFTWPWRMESWVSLGRKENHTNIFGRAGIELHGGLMVGKNISYWSTVPTTYFLMKFILRTTFNNLNQSFTFCTVCIFMLIFKEKSVL